MGTMKAPKSRASLSKSEKGTVLPKLDEMFYQEIVGLKKTPEKDTGEPRASVSRTALWLALLGGIFTVLVLFMALVLIRHYKTTAADTCVTEDCLVHASLLKDIVNTSIDPCYDFSAYVCSRWVPKHTRFRDNVHSVIDDLRYSWYTNFGEILRLGSLTLLEGKKPLAMYNMCASGLPSSENDTKLSLVLDFLRHLPPRVDKHFE
ncbi:hypothetical protein MTO96_011227 [Rhipicephalus appendiculatus]